VLSGERPRGRLFVVGSDWIYRREYRSVAEDLDTVAALGRDDIAAVLAKYPLTRGTTVTIGPLREEKFEIRSTKSETSTNSRNTND